MLEWGRMQQRQPTQRNQSGFSVVEASLVLLVVAVLAATGFVVYQHQKSTSAKNNTTTSPAQTSTPSQTDPYEGWQTYTSSVEESSFKYPPDWTNKALAASTEIELISPSKN